jgi:hypothetical protein
MKMTMKKKKRNSPRLTSSTYKEKQRKMLSWLGNCSR